MTVNCCINWACVVKSVWIIITIIRHSFIWIAISLMRRIDAWNLTLVRILGHLVHRFPSSWHRFLFQMFKCRVVHVFLDEIVLMDICIVLCKSIKQWVVKLSLRHHNLIWSDKGSVLLNLLRWISHIWSLVHLHHYLIRSNVKILLRLWIWIYDSWIVIIDIW